jgi:hypothetical protein
MTYHTIAVTTDSRNNRSINTCLIVENIILLYVNGFWGIKWTPANIDQGRIQEGGHIQMHPPLNWKKYDQLWVTDECPE